MNKLVTINAGGRLFQTKRSTLLRYPNTRFAQLFAASPMESADAPATAHAPTAEDAAVFLDVSPAVFEHVLSYLRTNTIHLPTNNDALRAELVHCMSQWDLLSAAFSDGGTEEAESAQGHGSEEGGEGEEAVVPARPIVQLPDVCVVQLSDHMQHDQGVKRHAMTITYGADGFQVRRLTRAVRRDLQQQLSSTYWQCYQTNERAAFFTTTKIANGAADLLTTSITQQLIEHTEAMGYHLTSSYITLSPDVVHTSVRMLLHNFIFRRTRLPVLEQTDEEAALLGELDADDGSDVMETFQNFEPRPVGPQKGLWQSSPSRPAPQETARSIW